MADIQVRIKLNAGVSGDEIHSVDFNQETNNVSKAVGSKTTQNSGQNLISWGTDGLISLADGYVGGLTSYLGKQGGYNGFVFGVVPANKLYSVEVTLEGKDIDSVTFYGDKNANQFPTRAIVNGEYVYSDDAEWTIVFPSSSATQTITFDMWNRANYNACFTHIVEFSNELVLDKRQIKSVESLSQSTGQPREIYYGVTPSGGSLQMLDVDGELKDYVQDGIIDIDNVPVDITIGDKTIHKHLLSINGYVEQGKSITSELVSDKETLYNRVHSLYPRVYSNMSIQQILFQLFRGQLDYTSEQYLDIFRNNNGEYTTIYTNSNIEEISIYDYLDAIVIQHFIPYSKTYRELISELLSLAQMQLIETDEGKTKIINARPRKVKNEKHVVIKKGNQFSSLESDIIVRNKYSNVQANVNNINYSVTSAYESSFSIVDSEGNISVSTINNSAKLETINDRSCICFFINVDSSNPIYDFTNTYDSTGVCAYEIEISGDNSTFKTERGDYIYNTNSTKEGYAFSTASKVVLLDTYSTLNSHTFAITLDLTESGIQSPKNARIRLIANKYDINEVETNYNSDNKNILTYSTSNYLTDSTMYKGVSIFDIVANNILVDYSKGIRTATISVGCLNYYFEDGSLAKDWSKGDILKINELVKVEGSDIIWRVTGRNFRKVGVPMIDLELQEVISPKYYLEETSYIDDVVYFDTTLYNAFYFNDVQGTISLLNQSQLTDAKIGNVLYRMENNYLKEYKILTSLQFDIQATKFKFDATITTYNVVKYI